MNSQIKSFRDLIVWQKATALAILLYQFTDDFPKTEIYGLIRSTDKQHLGRFNTSVLALSIFYILYSIFPIAPAHAGEIGLATTKDRFDIEMLAGDTYNGDLSIFNQSVDAALPVHIELSLWNIKEDSEDIEFVRSEPLLNATRWFEVEPKDFILDKNGARQVKFQITAPNEASPGAYLVMMRFRAVLPEYYFVQQGPRFIPELGVLFFINIRHLTLEGDEGNNKLRIASFEPQETHRLSFVEKYIIRSANAGVFDEAIKKLVAKIENSSIYYYKASGYVIIKNMFGQTVALVNVPERFLLPNRTRSIHIAVFTPAPEQSKSKILDSIFYILRENTYLGPYTASLVLNVPNASGQAEPISESINYWIIPWKFWSITFGAVLLIVLIILKLRRRFWLALTTLIG